MTANERMRRRRGAQESLAAVVLGFESVVVFLAGLAVFGLKAVPESVPSWLAIVLGAVVALLMVIMAGLVRHRFAIVTGWVLQLLVVAGGLLTPAVAVVGVVFGGLWAYANIKGAAVDRMNARRSVDSENKDGE